MYMSSTTTGRETKHKYLVTCPYTVVLLLANVAPFLVKISESASFDEQKGSKEMQTRDQKCERERGGRIIQMRTKEQKQS